MARAALTAAQAEEDQGSLTTLAEITPWRADLWRQAGQQALASGDYRTAIQYLETSAALEPLPAESLIDLGDALLETGDVESALATWQQALDHRAPEGMVYMRLARAHRSQGDYAATISDLLAVTQVRPLDSAARYELALLLAVYQPEASLAHLVQVAEQDPALAPLAEDLEDTIRQAAVTDDDPAYIRLVIGQSLGSAGEWQMAALAFEEATRLRPDYADAWAFLGEARYHLGQDGYPELGRAAELDSESLATNLLLALYWKRQGRYDNARFYQKIAAQTDPQNPALQVELGNSSSMLGEMQTALAYFQHAVELAPEEAKYWRTLANFSIQNELQIRDVGLAAARRAVILEKDDPESLDLMGQAYHLLGDPLLATRYLLRALDADPGYAPARLHIAMVYLAEGKLQSARPQLETVLNQAPDTALAETARQILQHYFP